MKRLKLLSQRFVSFCLAATLFTGVAFAQENMNPKARMQDAVNDQITMAADQSIPAVNSKDFLLNEGFTSGIPATWSQVGIGSGWAAYTDAGNPVARYLYSVQNNAKWLVTPAIVLPAAPQLLIFKEKGQYVDYMDYHAVGVSTSADMSNAVILYDGVPTTAYKSIYSDLTAFAGQTVYIGFFYQGYDADNWFIDDVQVDLRSNYGANEIVSFEFVGDVEAGPAVINEANGTVAINVWKMYQNSLNALTPVFTLSPGATVSPTVSGPQNFTQPFHMYIYAINGDMQDWTINVGVAPGRTSTELLGMTVPNQVGNIEADFYGRRLAAKVMFDSSLVFAPNFVTEAGATVAPTAPQNFTSGWVNYTVTSEDGLHTAVWQIAASRVAPSNEAKINSFTFPGMVNFQKVGNHYYAYAATGTDLSSLLLSFNLSFGATISPNTAQNFANGPVTYTVTAQDGTTTAQYIVHVQLADVAAPVVTYTATPTVSNVNGSVVVTSTEKPGKVALVKSTVTVTTAADIATAVTALNAVAANLTTEFSATLSTLGLNAGDYKAYAIDSTGNIASNSNLIAVFRDTMVVTSVAQLWTGFPSVIYNLTSEVVMTYKQTYRNQKFIQDATAGIMIDDNTNILATVYNIGDGITGLRGTILKYYNTMEFIPTQAGPAASSTGNTITPIDVPLNVYYANHYTYQSRLVRFQNVTISDITTGANGLFQTNKFYPASNYQQTGLYLRTYFFEPDYIGTALPTTPVDVVSIAGQYTSGTTVYRVFMPRSLADFTPVAAPEYYTSTPVVNFGLVNLGDAPTANISIVNIGADTLEVSNIVVSGAAQFALGTFTFPTKIAKYVTKNIPVVFTPAAVGDYTGIAVVTYRANNSSTYYTDTIDLLGTGRMIPIAQVPYSTDFEDFPTPGWTFGAFTVFNNPAYAHSGSYSIYMKYGTGMMTTPGFDLTNVSFPKLKMYQVQAFATQGTRSIEVSSDMVTWTVIQDQTFALPDITAGGAYIETSWDLSAYAGGMLYVRFVYSNPSSGLNNYWFIDDFSVKDVPQVPVVSIDDIDFGVVALNSTVTKNYNAVNAGISYFHIDSVKFTGTNAALFSVPAGFNASYVYTSVAIPVTFNATVTGDVEALMTVYYSDARNLGSVQVPVNAYVMYCPESPVITAGTNHTPVAPFWFRYQPTVDNVVTISSDLAGQAPDSRLFVYLSCDVTFLGTEGHSEYLFHDDISSDNYASTGSFFAQAGQTYYIYWDNKWDSSPFDFTLTEDVTPGAVCEMGIPTEIELGENTWSGTTETAANYYDITVEGLCNVNFIKGNDMVYTFTLEEPMVLAGSIDGSYVAMQIVNNPLVLPQVNVANSATCKAFAAQQGNNHTNFSNKLLEAGTYYIVVSTWAPPQFSAFTIHITAAEPIEYANVEFNVNMKYQMMFDLFNPAIHNVKVAGTMNNFTPETMTDVDGDSIYSITYFNVIVGTEIEYGYGYAGEGTDTTLETHVEGRTWTVVSGENIINDLFDNWTSVKPVDALGQLNVYPNPSNGKFTVTMKNSGNVNIEVINMKGVSVYKTVSRTAVTDIDLSPFAKGVYYLRVVDGSNTGIQKIVVE